MKKVVKGLVASAAAVATVASLAACVPSTATKAKTKLEKAGYEVAIVPGNLASLSGAEGVDEMITAVKGTEMVSAFYFTSTDAAKKFYDEVVSKETAAEGTVSKRSGKIVYGGTETAVKDFD